MNNENIDLDRVDASFTSKLWSWRIEAGEEHEEDCISFLRARLPHIAPDAWPSRFTLGGVYLNRSAVRPETVLEAPFLLEYYDPVYDPEKARTFFPQFTHQMVLHQDEDLAIVYKPAGLPTFAPRDQQLYHLAAYVEQHFQRTVHLPSRLDVGVAGLLLVSFTDRMNRHLQRAFDQRRVGKYYLAVVGGRPLWDQLDVTLPLGRDPRHPVLRSVRADGATAHTRLTTLGPVGSSDASVVLAQPLTGRTHQIRVHCAALGHAIVGDPYYGGEIATDIHLVSYAISFPQPYSRRPLELEVPEQLQSPWLREALCGITSSALTDAVRRGPGPLGSK